MRPLLYQTKDGFEMVNSEGKLYSITKLTGGGYGTRAVGAVNEAWHGSGRLLKKIPNSIKRLFFKLNTNGKEKSR